MVQSDRRINIDLIRFDFFKTSSKQTCYSRKLDLHDVLFFKNRYFKIKIGMLGIWKIKLCNMDIEVTNSLFLLGKRKKKQFILPKTENEITGH